MAEKRNRLFSDEQKREFIGSVKTGKQKHKDILENGMSLEEAFRYAYLDVSRAPLRGIAKFVDSPSEVRDQCIAEKILPFCKDRLLSSQCESGFDRAHQELSAIIKAFYTEKGYGDFTVGKTQKWINMALKYACIYDTEDAEVLQHVFHFCHVPIDRYVANPLVNELGVALPEYDGFVMPKRVPFDAAKCNYTWSRFDNYSDYLACQSSIREVLRHNSPEQCALAWEFVWWMREKKKNT